MIKPKRADLPSARRLCTDLLCLCVLALAAVMPARAEYPERLIRAIVPFATGGTNDITARLISPYLSKALGQPVIVENRPGAAGGVYLTVKRLGA